MSIKALSNKQIIQAILSGTYTPYDLREFVQLCHDLALPLIRKKFAQGKLSLDLVGLRESDVVYDCLADLFRRDEQGGFPQIKTYFEKSIADFDSCPVEELIISLRRLVLGKINNGLVRLYSEVDPALGKIIRNLRNAMEKSQLFDQVTRFNEVYLVPRSCDPLFSHSPVDSEGLRQEFARVALVHDNIPELLRKMHDIIAGHTTVQRAVSLVTVALLVKEVYALGWESEQEVNVAEEAVEADQRSRIVDEICDVLQKEFYGTYVEKGKVTSEIFSKYVSATRDILQGTLMDAHLDGSTYYEYVQQHVDGLSKEEYRSVHRPIIEYMVRVGKERLKQAMKQL